MALLTTPLARKVRCDQALPRCNRCVKLGVECQGYGLRLSWPRRNDRRRAIIGPNSKQIRSKGTVSDHRWVNAFSRDIRLHDRVSALDHIYGLTSDQMLETFPGTSDTGYLEKQEGGLLLLKSPSVGAIAQLSSSDASSVQYCMFSCP